MSREINIQKPGATICRTLLPLRIPFKSSTHSYCSSSPSGKINYLLTVSKHTRSTPYSSYSNHVFFFSGIPSIIFCSKAYLSFNSFQFHQWLPVPKLLQCSKLKDRGEILGHDGFLICGSENGKCLNPIFPLLFNPTSLNSEQRELTMSEHMKSFSALRHGIMLLPLLSKLSFTFLNFLQDPPQVSALYKTSRILCTKWIADLILLLC